MATDISTLLNGVKSKLISDAIFASNTVFVAAAGDELEFPPSDQWAVIQPGRNAVDEPIWTGAGNQFVYINGGFRLVLYSRLQLDQLPREDYFLTDSTLGIYRTFRCVVNSLSQYQVPDGLGGVLNAEPIMLISFDPPGRDRTNGWGSMVSDWRLNWQFSLGC